MDTRLKTLRELIPLKEPVNFIFHSVNRTGMRRKFRVLCVDKGKIRDITYMLADFMDKKFDEKTGTIAIGGCGMDMAFALAEQIKKSLYTQEEHQAELGRSYYGAYIFV